MAEHEFKPGCSGQGDQHLQMSAQETANAVDYWKTHRCCGVCRDYKTKRCDRFACMTIFIEEYRRREK
jgi:hypothetical protein